MARFQQSDDTIVALSTSPGMGAIAVIRLSGNDAFTICEEIFNTRKGGKLSNFKSHTLHYGELKAGGKLVDDVVVGIYKGPNSFTGEDTIEISCHGSTYIQQEILQLLLKKGARLAEPGEFTFRAFFNGKMDLSQAEAVADLIASQSASAHKVALQQMRGGFSNEIKVLRQKMMDFASLIELELDFAEEDVEFANRGELDKLVEDITKVIKGLMDSFALGNAIKNGIPIAIAGEPNVGKSTLLNALLQEDRAIVSDIAGTTRDTIEDEIVIEGLLFRFIDTAGIRETADTIEALGIGRTFEKIKISDLVLYLFDATKSSKGLIESEIDKLVTETGIAKEKVLIVINKADLADEAQLRNELSDLGEVIFISAKNNSNIEAVKQHMLSLVNTGKLQSGDTIVTNARHYTALEKSMESLMSVRNGLNSKTPTDLLAIDIRKALHHLGEITGEITTDDLLGNIFSKFCIGK